MHLRRRQRRAGAVRMLRRWRRRAGSRRRPRLKAVDLPYAIRSPELDGQLPRVECHRRLKRLASIQVDVVPGFEKSRGETSAVSCLLDADVFEVEPGRNGRLVALLLSSQEAFDGPVSGR